MENTMISINSKTVYSHDWSFFEKLGFSKTEEKLILPEEWLIIDEPFKPYRLKSLQPFGAYNRSVAVWCARDGIAEKVVITTRYYVRCMPGFHSKKKRIVYVYDKKEDKVMFATEECKCGSEEERINIEKCREFLKLNYPDFENPSAYWNE